MITISVCMIVKNESNILSRCLDSLQGIWDELIIVDTGSTDDTIRIAKEYTDKVYEFEWTGDFSEARNFSLAQATCDYIYTADADEILEGENVEMFKALKSCLDPTIDVVQMYYGNQLDHGTVYNYDKELRPKLFKRVKPILFIDPIHETLAIEPVVYDSDIVITHKPQSQHNTRDLSSFKRVIDMGEELSPRLQGFLCRELYLADDPGYIMDFASYLQAVTESPDSSDKQILEAACVLMKHHRICGEYIEMFDNAVKLIAMNACSEVCVELGLYYLSLKRYEDAAVWFYNAYHESSPILSIHASTDIPLNGMADVYSAYGDTNLEAEYRQMAIDMLEEARRGEEEL